MTKAEKIDLLDSLVSKYVRLAYADDAGYVQCFTCSNKRYWKQMQNGHFHSRRHMALRFDTRNCFPQCNECNVDKCGNLEEFRKQLTIRFGPEFVEWLDLEKNKFKQWTIDELNQEIVKLRKILREQFDIY